MRICILLVAILLSSCELEGDGSASSCRSVESCTIYETYSGTREYCEVKVVC